jgi:hypothetical protein
MGLILDLIIMDPVQLEDQMIQMRHVLRRRIDGPVVIL